jgi:hypothetical protein
MLFFVDFFTLSRHVGQRAKVRAALREVVTASADVWFLILAFMVLGRSDFRATAIHYTPHL